MKCQSNKGKILVSEKKKQAADEGLQKKLIEIRFIINKTGWDGMRCMDHK